MKITSDNWRTYFLECPVILVDGATVDRVIEADDDAGYVIAYVTRDGELVFDKDKDAIATQRITGKVEFIGARRAA